MPLTLYKYILGEILKLMLIATLVMVVVMSFGFAIKPISEGLLGPWQLVKVVMYTIPGMVGFALPFAAALAGTLVFFRMGQDNEITAWSVSGISYHGLLSPVLGLGLGLTLLAFILSNWVVPKFLQMVEKEIQQDVVAMAVKQVGRGNVFSLGEMVIYADDVNEDVAITEVRKPGEPMPYRRMMLWGVAVGRFENRKGILRADYTAERAIVDMYRDESNDHTYATMMLLGTMINDPRSGMLIFEQRQEVHALEIPSPFHKKPQFMSLGKLRRLAKEPQRSPRVRKYKQKLIEALAARHMQQHVYDRLGSGERSLKLISPQGYNYHITSPSIKRHKQDLLLKSVGDTKVVVANRIGDLTTQRLKAASGKIEMIAGDVNAEPRINLTLYKVQVFDPALPTPSSLNQVKLPLLHMDEPIMATISDDIPSLITEAGRDPSGDVGRIYKRLRGELVRLIHKITSRLHERAALAVNCMLVLLLGAVMSMMLRDQTPLAIFFWCFMPTVATFLTIISGRNMIDGTDVPQWVGVLMAWAGNGALLTLTIGIYFKLNRN